MTVRTRIEWTKFRECGKLLQGSKLFVKNERTYQGCKRSVKLYRSKTWCLRENEIAILRKTKIAMCGVKLIEKRISQELADVLELEEF